MKIIHTSDFKNNTILAENGIKCVIRGYAFVNDTKKWLYKKATADTTNYYELEDITLEELCKNCQLVTDEDKYDADILNNLFDITYEPCLELTVPEIEDTEKGTVLGGEKFCTYKIRINSALNNKTKRGIQGTYRAIVLIGEKYTEDEVHVITKNKSYIAMYLLFGDGEMIEAEDRDGLHITDDTAFTINLQFSLSQISPAIIADLKDSSVSSRYAYRGQDPSAASGFKIELDPEYAKIMAHSYQKDQTTTKLALPGAFLVPSGKEYKTRVEVEVGVRKENEGIAYMDKTFNLIPDTYKNNNIFNVIPRVNIFDEHNDKFVKPQTLLSYGGITSGDYFGAQSIAIEYDPTYFAMNEKAPTGNTRFDLFGGATKKENKNYDDTYYKNTEGYLRLICDRGQHYEGKDDLFILSRDNNVGMTDGSLMIADGNFASAVSGLHIIDSRGQSATNITNGHIIDSEKNVFDGQHGVTAFASQNASALSSTPSWEEVKTDPYKCPDCNGSGIALKRILRYVAAFYDETTEKLYIALPSFDAYGGYIYQNGDIITVEGTVQPNEIEQKLAAALQNTNKQTVFDKSYEDAYNVKKYTTWLASWLKDTDLAIAPLIAAAEPMQVRYFMNGAVRYFPVYKMKAWDGAPCFIYSYEDSETHETIYGTVEPSGTASLEQSLEDVAFNGNYDKTGKEVSYATYDEARITMNYVNNKCWHLNTGAEPEPDTFTPPLDGTHVEIMEHFVPFLDDETHHEQEQDKCLRCNGDGRFGAYGYLGRLAMIGLNVSSTEFNGHNNFFIGHKGLASNFGHDAIVFGNHNACGNKEYDECTACSGTGLITCSGCSGTGKEQKWPFVECPNCQGYGMTFTARQICYYCNGTGIVNGAPCPNCYDPERGIGTGEIILENDTAIYTCEMCEGKKVIRENVADPEGTAGKDAPYILCETCSGYGKMSDPVCSGMGFVESYEHKNRYSACPDCSDFLMQCPQCAGKGTGEPCVNCNGTGEVNGVMCQLCNGTGWLGNKCSLCNNDLQVCKTCSGQGTYDCPTCSGTAWLRCCDCSRDEYICDCSACGGIGYLYDGYIYGGQVDHRTVTGVNTTAWTPVDAGTIWDYEFTQTTNEYLTSAWKTLGREEAWSGLSNEFWNLIVEQRTHQDIGGLYNFCVSSFEDINDPAKSADAVSQFRSVAVSKGTELCPVCSGKCIDADGKQCTNCDGIGIVASNQANHYMLRVACPFCNNMQRRFDTWRDVGLHMFANRWAPSLYEHALNDGVVSGSWGKMLTNTISPGYDTCDLCSGDGMTSPEIAIDYLKNVCHFDDDDAIVQLYENGKVGEAFNGFNCRACPKCSNLVGVAKTYPSVSATIISAMSGENEGKQLINYYFAAHNLSNGSSGKMSDWGVTGFCRTCNDNAAGEKPGFMVCPNCNEGQVDCETCNGVRHWYCQRCGGVGEVEYKPTVAYEDGKVIAVGDGYFYKNLMEKPEEFDLYRDYINIKPDTNCDLGIGQYIKKMNLFSVENHGLITVHNNNYDEVPDSNVKHQMAADFFAVRSWAKYNDLQERFANLQNGLYAPDAIYFSKRTAHNEEWKLRIRELDYLIHDQYIKANASWLKTAALNQAISDFYKKNNTFLLRLGPIITYAWKGIKGSKGAKGTKGWKGRKGIKGVTLGLKGKKGMKGLLSQKGSKGMTLQIINKRYKYYIEDILAAVRTEFGKYISNNGNLGKNPETYTFYCVNADPTETLYFKGIRLRKMTNGNYQTLNAVKGINPAEVQRIIYKDNGYYGEYGVMNFNYAYNNRFLT